jgi:hypothetical protein
MHSSLDYIPLHTCQHAGALPATTRTSPTPRWWTITSKYSSFTTTPWVSVHGIWQNWVDILMSYVLLFGVVYLACRYFEMDPTKSQRWCTDPPKRERPNSPRPIKVRHVRGRVKSMLISFDIKGIFRKRICPGRPNSQFRILLWRFKPAAWKCAKISPRIGCWGDYLDRSRKKSKEVRENCIKRSFLICTHR